MANTILTPTQVTRAALAILHQKLNFVGNINRQYDDQYAVDGAKIGSQLKIRLPNQYTVTTGAALAAQDTTENSTTLTVSTQKHVDLNFTSADLTLSVQDFSDRFLDPAMAALAANIEADAFSMANDVYPVINNIGSTATLRTLLLANKSLQDYLAPPDMNKRTTILNTTDNVDLIDALKGLFQDSKSISAQYQDGVMGSTAGFGKIAINTLLPSTTSGTAVSATGYTVNGATQTGSSIIIQGAATTFAVGDVITFAGCNRCHPETKADSGALQQFVVTTAYTGGAGSIQVSPTIVTSGATQSVFASPTNGGAIVKVGGASAVYKSSLAFHRDAFTIAFADLIMPKNQHFAAREVMDGISMRIVQAYDINNDKLPCRIDVLYGYKTIRPQLACRILSN
jgi:hypothetical protein